MDRRIQQALDGEMRREDLTRALSDEFSEVEGLMQRVTESIPEEPLPDLGPSVVARIRAMKSSAPHGAGTHPRLRTARADGERSDDRGRGALRWLWEPRPLRWRPVYALAAAVILVAFFASSDFTGWRTPAAPVPSVAPQVFVQFRLEAPQASQVMLAGDFTQWRPAHVLSRSPSGVWSVVIPLEPGVHEYAFVIDGSDWVADPLAPRVDDGFGGVNSRLAVLTPDEPRPL